LNGAETRSSAKSLIILTGAFIGFVEGLRLCGFGDRAVPPSSVPSTDVTDRLENRIAALEGRFQELEGRSAQAVTQDELRESVLRATTGLEELFENRFAHQERAAEALKSMIAETDQMLERVLEGLDMLAESRGKAESAARR
jgi:uncharacterized coiled-coil protein SlyX